MPTKWDDKAERDLLLAMRMAEGTNTISKETWEKATELMKAMGHTDATVSCFCDRFFPRARSAFTSCTKRRILTRTATVDRG